MKIFGFEFSIRLDSGPCEKLDYRSEAKAVQAIAKQAKLGRTRYYYQCPRCRGWHLTKMKQ